MSDPFGDPEWKLAGERRRAIDPRSCAVVDLRIIGVDGGTTELECATGSGLAGLTFTDDGSTCVISWLDRSRVRRTVNVQKVTRQKQREKAPRRYLKCPGDGCPRLRWVLYIHDQVVGCSSCIPVDRWRKDARSSARNERLSAVVALTRRDIEAALSSKQPAATVALDERNRS